MEKKNDIIGTKISIYRIIYECDFKTKCGHRIYHAKCEECGMEIDATKSDLKRTKSCKHIGVYGNKTRNLSWKEKRLDSIYRGMLRRCYNPADSGYSTYGGKGIELCKDWFENPLSFENWSLENGYGNTLTIDRINSEKGYSPENCRWVTLQDNCKYKSTTRIIEVDDVLHTGREWAFILGIGTNTINTMLRNNSEAKVKDFIQLRLKDPTKVRSSRTSWFDTYNI